MADKRTSDESPIGVLVGDELFRIAKNGSNYKATLNEIKSFLGGLPGVLSVNNNSGGNNLSMTYGDSLLFPNPGVPTTAASIKQTANGLMFDVNSGGYSVYLYHVGKSRTWIPWLEATDLFSATIATYGLTVGYQYTPGNGINFYTASSGIFRIKAPSLTADVNYMFPVREAASLVTNQVLAVSGISGSDISLNWVAFPASTLVAGTTTITGGSAGRILFDNGSVVSESANLVWDNSSGQLEILSAGTALLPCLVITQTDLGLFQAATDEIGVTTGGTERFRFSSNVFKSATTAGPSIRRAAGAAATPTYAFVGTVGTGQWLNGTSLAFSVATVNRVEITNNGSVLLAKNGALATTATDGFTYLPTCAGIPTGVPTTQTGMAPVVVDTTNNKMYVYSGGAWRILN